VAIVQGSYIRKNGVRAGGKKRATRIHISLFYNVLTKSKKAQPSLKMIHLGRTRSPAIGTTVPPDQLLLIANWDTISKKGHNGREKEGYR
jgi:hypothetical protein